MSSKNEAKIRFAAETEEFSQGVKSANAELSELRAEMKLNEAQFENTGNSAEYMKNKQNLLEQALEANKDKQEALTEKLEVAKQIYGEGSEEVSKLQKQLTYAQIEEEKLKSQVNDTNSSLGEQKNAAEDAGGSVDTMADILVNAGVASAIKDIADAAVELAGDFSEASAAIVEGTGASGEALEELNASAQAAFQNIADSDATIGSVSDTLAELNTRFGLTGDAATDMTTKISNFAQHTGTDGVTAVDSIADITHRWGLSIDDVDGLLDDLTTANQSCQLNIDQLTGYLTNNSTAFQELGYSTTDALAMLISLSDGGANVGTVMSGMTKAVTNLSAKTDDVPGTFQSAIDTISNCSTVTEALQAEIGDTGLSIEDVFGKKAAQELATNIQNGSMNIDKWTQALDTNTGALSDTTENATTMQDAWSQASNNITLAIGGMFTPAISDAAIKIADVATKVSEVVQESPALQAVIIAVTAALVILAGALAISSLISAVQKAFALLNTTMLANPIFLIVTAIAALAAGLVYAYQHCETFRNIVNKAFEGIKTAISTVVDAAISLKDKVVGAWDTAKEAVSNGWQNIKNIFSNIINWIKSNWQGLLLLLVNPFAGAFKLLYDNCSGFREFIDNFMSKIHETISNIGLKIKETASNIFSKVKEAITHPIETAKETISNLAEKIKGIFEKLKIKLPDIKLPHFKISGGEAPWGIAGKGTKPTVDVEWYRAGAVLKRATQFGTSPSGTPMVGGEAGYEAIAPIDVLQGYVAEAVEAAGGTGSIDYDLLGEATAKACARMNITINLDNREIGRLERRPV